MQTKLEESMMRHKQAAANWVAALETYVRYKENVRAAINNRHLAVFDTSETWLPWTLSAIAGQVAIAFGKAVVIGSSLAQGTVAGALIGQFVWPENPVFLI